MIVQKINTIINETGEHPYLFSKNGRAVFVKFPKNVSDYLLPDEIDVAEKYLIDSVNKQRDTSHENKNISLLGALLKADEKAETYRKERKIKEINKNNKIR